MAAVYTNKLELTGQSFARLTEREKQARLSCQHILESYHYVKGQAYVDAMRRDKVKVFLDSGAFSAHNSGATIDIKEFCRYIHENSDLVEMVSVLDAIGSAQATWDNQQVMERHGVKPLPCFHFGEDERYLEHYVKNYEYISLGGVAQSTTQQLVIWLDRLWERYLTDSSGRPRLKVHGFAITSLPVMTRYPWYSVDSTSWMAVGANGAVLMPTTLKPLQVSADSPNKKEMGRHLDTLPALQRNACCEAIAEQGFDSTRLASMYLARWAFNMNTFNIVNKRLGQKELVFKNEQIGIF